MNLVKTCLCLLVGFVFSLSCTKNDHHVKLHRVIHYPESQVIDSLRWTSDPSRYPGTNSDMHWWTWGIDSAVYIVDDDGKNFDGPAHYAHVLRITGIPPNHRVETVTDFQGKAYDFRHNIPDELVRRYLCGIVSVDSILYVTLYDYDWNLPPKFLIAIRSIAGSNDIIRGTILTLL